MATYLKLPNSILVELLTIWIGAVWGAGSSVIAVHLYKSAYTPAPDDVLADYSSIEADFGGYSSQTLDTVDWTDPVLDGDVAITYAQPLVFIATGASLPQTIYGYYVTNGGNTKLLWAQEFEDAVVLTNPDDYVLLNLVFDLASEH